MRTPADAGLHAPEFPREIDWLNAAPVRVGTLQDVPLLVEFWDFGRVNSLRTLPYLKAWHQRYGPLGLRVIGVHCPGYSFGRDPAAVAAAVERLEIEHAVAIDSAFSVWRAYGNRGWPARYLFDHSLRLRDVHYGEGAYRDGEVAIQTVLREHDPDLDLPAPLDPLRPEDAPDALLRPQTADLELPRERSRLELVRDWSDGSDWIEAAAAGAAATVRFEGAGAYAVLSGPVDPGPYATDGTVVAAEPGLRLHGFQFLPAQL